MNKKKKWLFFLKLYPVLILSTILFMCIGYAATGEINLSITGNAFAQMKKEVYITESIYQNDINAYKDESSLKSISSTVLNSKIKLSETDSNSQITYKVTLYNNNDYDVEFDNITFDDGFYDNQNIIFELSDNLTQNTTLKSKSYTTFQITFKYKDGFTPSNTTNQLNAYLNINIKLKEHTVTLVYNDGVTPNTQVKASTYAQLPNPTREGYGFDGWYLYKKQILDSFQNSYSDKPWTEESEGTWIPYSYLGKGVGTETQMETSFEIIDNTGIFSFEIEYVNMGYNSGLSYTITNQETNEKITNYINYQNLTEKINETLSKGVYKLTINVSYVGPADETNLLKIKNIHIGTYGEKIDDIIKEDTSVIAKWGLIRQITFKYYLNDGSEEPFQTWVAKNTSNYPDNHFDYTYYTKPGYIATGYYGTTPTGGILVGQDEPFYNYQQLCEKYGVDPEAINTEINIYGQWIIEEVVRKITFRYYKDETSEEPFVTWLVTEKSDFPDNHWNYRSGEHLQTKIGYTPTGYYGTTPTGGILVGEDEPFYSYEQICEKYGVDVNAEETIINIYAQWTKTPPTVTLKYDDGITPDSQIQTTSSADLPVPTREGYAFGGWYLYQEGFSEEVTFSTAANSTYPWTETSDGVWVSSNSTPTEQSSVLTSDVFTVSDGGATLSFDWKDHGFRGGGSPITYTVTNVNSGTVVVSGNISRYLDSGNEGSKSHELSGGVYQIVFTAKFREPAVGSTPQFEVSNVCVFEEGSKDTEVPSVIVEDIIVTAVWSKVVVPVAQSNYSADDNTLTFVYDMPYTAGEDTFTRNGVTKNVTAVYTGFDKKIL